MIRSNQGYNYYYGQYEVELQLSWGI